MHRYFINYVVVKHKKKKAPTVFFNCQYFLLFAHCKADIRNPLRYLLMNAVASRSVSGSFQLPLT